MKEKFWSINFHRDSRYPRVNAPEMCPVQLAVRIGKSSFKMGLRLSSSIKVFEAAMQGRGGNSEAKELRQQMAEYRTKAEALLEKMPNPSRETFQRLFRSTTDLYQSSKTAVEPLFKTYIEDLQKEERIKSAMSMQWALKSFLKFRPKLFFEDIDEAFLKGYRNWMLNEGSSGTTVQIYQRSLRIICNLAVKQGYISERFYPFKNYSIGTSAKSKDVLYAEQIKALWEYEPKTLREKRARCYWVGCYLMSGVNFKDFCYLKWKNIKGSIISFVREKTKRTNSVSDKHIKVYMHEELRKIIEEWGCKKRDADSYVFPILNGYETVLEKEKRRKTIQRITNRSLNDIGKKLGFDVNLTLSLARHSYASLLNANGTPISLISESLGHTQISTTQNYLKSLPDSKYKEISESLLKFD